MNVHSAFNKKALSEGKKEYLRKGLLFKLYIADYIFFLSIFLFSKKKKKIKTFKMSLARLHNEVTFIFKLNLYCVCHTRHHLFPLYISDYSGF